MNLYFHYRSPLKGHWQDFEGQKLVEQVSRNALVVATVGQENVPLWSYPEPCIAARRFHRRLCNTVVASVVWRVRSVRGWAQFGE